MPHNPDLRKSAVERFERDWGDTLEAAAALHACFEHLEGSLATLAQHGSRQTLTLPNELEQQWWVAYQEARGNMIPRSPEEAPIPAEEPVA